MNNERRAILQMLSDGKISADEAERLMSAMDGAAASTAAVAGPAIGHNAQPKYLRVTVDALEDTKPVKVNVRVPMALLRAGVRLTSLIPPAARDEVNRELSKNGVPFDIGQLKPENLDELINHLNELTVDVDSAEAKVRVYCE